MQQPRQKGRQTVYQSRRGDRLFGAGDHISLVVDLEDSGQKDRQDRAKVTRLSVQTFTAVKGRKEGKSGILCVDWKLTVRSGNHRELSTLSSK